VGLASGADLALLLLGGFEAMVDDVVAQLASRGHAGVRPVHEFALRAIDGGAHNAADLGRRLSVSRQAAAKTIAALEQMGYVDRVADARDGRRKRLVVTPRGREMTALGAALFDEVRDRWAAQVGARKLDGLQALLRELLESRSVPTGDTGPLDAAAAGRR
jgi:DNA-binding MarR family transcriptional regulator